MSEPSYPEHMISHETQKEVDLQKPELFSTDEHEIDIATEVLFETAELMIDEENADNSIRDLYDRFRIKKMNRVKKVENRNKEMQPVKFYHASPTRFRHGEKLYPSERSKNLSHFPNVVFLTISPVPHHTIVPRILAEDETRQMEWWNDAWEGNWWVYEVKPPHEIIYGGYELEIGVKWAEVIRTIGNAKGILQHEKDKFKRKMEKGIEDKFPFGPPIGSLVPYDFHAHGHKTRGRGRYYSKDEISKKNNT